MGAPKPCLGYPSRIDAVIALVREGCTMPEVAQRTGEKVTVVSADLLNACKPGLRVPLRKALAPAAEARGITPEQLAARLLVELALDRALLDNVLDDRKGGRDAR